MEYSAAIKNEDLCELICSHFQNIFLSEKSAKEYKYTKVGYLLFNEEGDIRKIYRYSSIYRKDNQKKIIFKFI